MENNRAVYDGTVHKCPQCGEVISSFVSICPACGFEFREKKVAVALQDFIEKINKSEKAVSDNTEEIRTGWKSWSKSKKFWWIVLNIICVCVPLVIYLVVPLIMIRITPKLTKEEQQKVSLIENFSFPNDRESILAALLFTKEKVDFMAKETINRKSAYWLRLWYSKAVQLKQKADMLFPNDIIVDQCYKEITGIKNQINKVIKIKAVSGSVILLIALVILFARFGLFDNTTQNDKKDYNATYEWQQAGIFAEIPKPETDNGKIVMETENQIKLELYKVTANDFETYVKKCREAGFTEKLTKMEDAFYATNGYGYNVNIYHDDEDNTISINVYAPKQEPEDEVHSEGTDGFSTEIIEGEETILHSESDEVESQAVLSEDVTVSPNTYINIEESAYLFSDEFLQCIVKIKNLSDKKVIEYPTYRVTVYDENNKVLGTQEHVLSIIYPNQEIVDDGVLMEISSKPHRVEVTALEPDEYNITDVSMMEHPVHVQMVGRNLYTESDMITGEIYNPNDYMIDSAKVTVVIRNEEGTIVASEMDFVDQIPAEGCVPFQVYARSELKSTDKIEVYAYIW